MKKDTNTQQPTPSLVQLMKDRLAGKISELQYEDLLQERNAQETFADIHDDSYDRDAMEARAESRLSYRS